MNPAKYAEYAKHLNDFVTYMKNNNVNLYGISIQNEPDYASEWTWWTPTEMVNFLKNNAKSIDCRIIAPESFQYTKSTSDPLINDSQAWAEVDILGTHLYGTQVSQFSYPLFDQKKGNRELWMTEVYYPNSSANSGNKWPEALEVADHIGNAMVVGNFQAYVWWYIRRPYSFIDEDGSVTKRGSFMAQYSKFIRPGFVRIDATQHPSNDNNLNISAYKKDSKVVIVAVNRNTSPKTLTISIPNTEISTWERYVTNQTQNVAKQSNVSSNGTTFQITLEAQSTTTFVGEGEKGAPKIELTAPTGTEDFESPATIVIKANASDEDGTIQRVEFYNGKEKIGESTNAPYSFSWENVSEGTYSITAVAIDNDKKEARASVEINVHVPQTPYKGTPSEIPGKIEVEDYDLGGNDIAYYDKDNTNKGNEYRNDGVDIYTCDGGYALGYTENGEWTEYTINAKYTDVYNWEARVASGNATSSFFLSIDGEDVTGTISVPKTEDNKWDTYTTIKGTTKSKITEGKHVLRLTIDGSYANIDWINFTSETVGIEQPTAEIVKPVGKFSVFDLNGKQVGRVKIGESETVKEAMDKLNLPSAVYVLSNNKESYKVEVK